MDLATQPVIFLPLDGVCMELTNNSRDPWGNEVVERRAADADENGNEVCTDTDSIPHASANQKLYGIGPYRRSGVAVGWRVSINRRGDFVNRYFVAKKFGGMDQALRAAITFRDEVNQTFAPLTKREQCAVLRSSNTSGIPGVFRTTSGEWKARILFSDGRCKTQQFSVLLYGEDEARRKAIRARAELLNLVQGHALHHDEMRNADLPELCTVLDIVITPHKDKPTPSPYDHPRRRNAPGVGVGAVNIKTCLSNGETVVTKYRVAVFKKPDGLPKRRYFSVTRYGEEIAALLAIEQRQAWEREAIAAQCNDQKPRHKVGFAISPQPA
jgi:hypothetical protein